MREEPIQYVFNYGRQPPEAQAFDLVADSGETRNLAPDLPEDELRAAEERLMGVIFSVEAFYEAHPLRNPL